jgi:hypothetical protein
MKENERDYFIQVCGELAFRKMCGLPIDIYTGADKTRHGEVTYPNGCIIKVITTTDEDGPLVVPCDEVSERADYLALMYFDEKTNRAVFKGAISTSDLISRNQDRSKVGPNGFP